jgi:hypothetical protein
MKLAIACLISLGCLFITGPFFERIAPIIFIINLVIVGVLFIAFTIAALLEMID